MILFRILLGIDIIVALVFVYFFVIGLGDGSVSSFNMDLWIGTLVALAAVLGGGAVLNRKGHRGPAIALLLVLAIPAVLFGLFMLAIIVLQPRWN